MRLPFGLGRRSSSGNGASGGSSDVSSPTVSRSAASGSGAVPARPRAWASLPPIQRTAGSMPMVASPGEFVDALSGTQGLPPVVQQLGHEVSPMATPGLVVARVRAVEQASGSIPAPVQRRARRAVQRQADAAAAESFDTREADPVVTAAAPVVPSPSVSRSVSASSSWTAAPVVARSSAADSAGVDAGDDDDVAAASSPAPDMAPVRSLPTVSRSAIRVPDRPLTSAASVVRPIAQRSHAGHAHPSPAADGTPAAATPLPAPSGGMRRAPSNPALARSAMPTVSRESASAAPAASPASASSASPSATAAAGHGAHAGSSLPTLAPASSRRGVGEPTSLPPTARPVGATPAPVVSRSTMAGPMPLASSSLRTTIQRTADGGEEDEAGEDAPVQRSIASSGGPGMPSLPSLPVLTVSRSARDGGAGAAAASTASASARPAIASSSAGSSPSATPLPPAAAGSAATPIQRSAAPAIRPIAAHNPLRPSIALQREADGQPVDGDDEDGGLPSPWWAPASEGTSVGASMAGLARSGEVAAPSGSAAVQRTASAASNPVSTAAALIAAAQAPGSRSTVHGVQRSTRATASPGAPPKLPLAVPHAESARQQTASSAPAAAAGPSITFPGAGIVSGPSVQTSRTGSPTPALPAHSESHVVQRVESSSSAASVAAPTVQPGQSERDLDELAKALFGRIRTRLRNDLLNDREAAGLTFDIV